MSCSKNKPVENSTGNFSYLALGDSYTIGESVRQDESFPYQLASILRTDSIDLLTPKIVARTGWTTDELQVAINSENIQQQFDIVTLLIGVNNQFRGYSQSQYRKEFKALLQQAVSFAGGNKKHVFVISIPDWAVTPFGKNSGRNTATISAEIDAFNAINREES
ncbi:GDSL-type esterase/lipase family protein [Niabella ginsengisoli]|uniref:GDSL-type esterase/lipase family protein n=1 Tax=Niabella ginsengisoli TaxID=522298 RepID=A0ABS9SKI1_9BACT|nr:GDSL-type esterase/lipase family protein [Niabella ginsengisoli]MCH5598811.1 GDSL-type esterase/lipase family protein [Niabella ginsengisoli]